ncbi:MAG: response regulator transcription factor [Candidatus Dojkabacteria bacterium]
MKVLIVEDENSIREVEAAYLSHSGFEVVEAVDGKEALNTFAHHKFDLVILDINLPEINGITVCKKIRETSNIPIIMVTARAEDIDELVGFECGADDYIKKPFTPSILVARVTAVLKRISGAKLENEYLAIDPEKMNIKVKQGDESKVVEVTTTEFNILYTLMKNPGKVFTRYEIIDRAYDNSLDADILERTVDVHIKNLRKKLNILKNLPEFVITVIGKGYKFNDNL